MAELGHEKTTTTFKAMSECFTWPTNAAHVPSAKGSTKSYREIRSMLDAPAAAKYQHSEDQLLPVAPLDVSLPLLHPCCGCVAVTLSVSILLTVHWLAEILRLTLPQWMAVPLILLLTKKEHFFPSETDPHCISSPLLSSFSPTPYQIPRFWTCFICFICGLAGRLAGWLGWLNAMYLYVYAAAETGFKPQKGAKNIFTGAGMYRQRKYCTGRL